MENFIVSARKYRPTDWDTVVGQESITGTLRNAIEQNHLAQAYLFCGPRGVGKTTCARIFAKEINISEGSDPDDDFSFNIFELDAASNNSVEDIRSITDQVRIPPQVGKYRVFIIDEVHMLSQQAFNAFLKTLEEPPPHAIFILATTEKHKIIPTILSRCQIFDFNRIQIPDIAKHLAKISEKEGIAAEPDALHIIAQKADGALRDALSIFDQIVAFAGNEITYQAVIDNLNILDYDYYFKVTDHLLKEEIPPTLLLFNEILNNGFDGHNFVNGLGAHFRNLMVCKDEGTVKLLEVGDNIKARYLEQAGATEIPFLLGALEIISKADVQYKASKNQRLLVELALMQLCSFNDVGAEKKKPSYGYIKPSDKELTRKITTKENRPSVAKGYDQQGGKSTAAESPSSYGNPPAHTENDAPRRSPSDYKKLMGGQSKFATASISSVINPQQNKQTASAEEQAGEMDLSNRPKDPFTEAELMNVWRNYAAQMKQAGKVSLYNTLVARDPEVDGNSIKLVIDNKVQMHTLDVEKGELLHHVRDSLNNWSIDFEARLIEQGVDDNVKFYSPMDRFKKMAEKNPALLQFQKKLNLDIEH